MVSKCQVSIETERTQCSGSLQAHLRLAIQGATLLPHTQRRENSLTLHLFLALRASDVRYKNLLRTWRMQGTLAGTELSSLSVLSR